MTNLGLDEVVALNALIVTAIGLSLAFGRRDRKTGPLDLGGPRRLTAVDELNAQGKGASSSQQKAMSVAAHAPMNSAKRQPGGSNYGAAALRKLEDQESQPSRQLNVFFNWNGHTWDAYEVLGVPAGASRDSVVQAFHQARIKSPDSIAFLQAATDAILKGRRS